MITGRVVSKGIAIGGVFIVKEKVTQLTGRRIADNEISEEIRQLDASHRNNYLTTKDHPRKAEKEIGADNAQVFEVHQMLVADPTLRDAIITKVKEELIGIEDAASKALEEFREIFEQMDDEYMRARSVDIADIRQRLINNLLGKQDFDLSSFNDNVIIIAKDLAPSDTVAMDKAHIKGLATEIGSETSHTAIIAWSLDIPAIVGCGKGLKDLKPADIVILDGSEGVIHTNPDPQTIAHYRQKSREFFERRERFRVLKYQPAITLDGHRVEMTGNIAKADDAIQVLAYGGEAVGLFRTEFLYMNRNALSSEEEQFMAYEEVA